MKKFKNKYRISSARAQWWDYGNNGAYFITICTKDRQHFFGQIREKEMFLSDLGQLAQQYWQEIPQRFDYIQLGEMVIMPNHLHGIVIIDKNDGDDVETRLSASLHHHHRPDQPSGITGNHNPMLHDNLSRVVRWFKGRTTFECRKINPLFQWQTRFHDHIIRNEASFYRIQQYIVNNPAKWNDDKFFDVDVDVDVVEARLIAPLQRQRQRQKYTIAIPNDYQHIIRQLDCFQLLKDHQVLTFHQYETDENTLAEWFKEADVLILTRTRTKITASLLAKLPNLKLISQTGKNAGHIDIAACTKHGVAVVEGKGNPIATAELTWLLIMNGLRQIPQAIEGMRAGKWQINIGSRVYGKTIGIWSYGKIGKLVANYAKAFGAKVLIWGSESSCAIAQEEGFEIAKTKKDFFAQADVVSIHIRLKESTKGIIKREDLSNMKPTALFVNTSRAALLEKDALLDALQKGRPGFAAIDVYDEEPIFDKNHPLLKMSNVICTPHLGYVEKEGYELYFSIAFQNALDFIAGKIDHLTNLEVFPDE